MDLLDSKVFDLQQKTDKCQKEVCDVKEFIESNDVLCHQMQTHINELEQYSRRNSIRIFGIEKQTNEKLTETICKFSKQKLNIDLQPHFIDRCHPVGNYQNRNAVLVKFVSHKHKQDTIKARRALKGSGIIIAEDLTRTNYELLRKTQKHPKILNCWTTDGKVTTIVKSSDNKEKKMFINSLQDLEIL